MQHQYLEKTVRILPFERKMCDMCDMLAPGIAQFPCVFVCVCMATARVTGDLRRSPVTKNVLFWGVRVTGYLRRSPVTDLRDQNLVHFRGYFATFWPCLVMLFLLHFRRPSCRKKV